MFLESLFVELSYQISINVIYIKLHSQLLKSLQSERFSAHDNLALVNIYSSDLYWSPNQIMYEELSCDAYLEAYTKNMNVIQDIYHYQCC